MKCSNCDEEIESCDGCRSSFKYTLTDEIVCDNFTKYHYCDWRCHPNLCDAEVVEKN